MPRSWKSERVHFAPPSPLRRSQYLQDQYYTTQPGWFNQESRWFNQQLPYFTQQQQQYAQCFTQPLSYYGSIQPLPYCVQRPQVQHCTQPLPYCVQRPQVQHCTQPLQVCAQQLQYYPQQVPFYTQPAQIYMQQPQRRYLQPEYQQQQPFLQNYQSCNAPAYAQPRLTVSPWQPRSSSDCASNRPAQRADVSNSGSDGRPEEEEYYEELDYSD